MAGILAAVVTVLLSLVQLVPPVWSIGCYVCSSQGGSQPSCDDTFHNNQTSQFFNPDCPAGRKGRAGIFPASTCLKISGRYCR